MSSIWGTLSNLSNYYQGLKHGISQIYHGAKKIAHGVRSGADWLHEKLDQASSIPFIGQAASESIKAAREYKVAGIASFNDILNYARKIDDTFTKYDDTAFTVGNTLDYYIAPVVESAAQFGRDMSSRGVGAIPSGPVSVG